jgi:hypothetical protein
MEGLNPAIPFTLSRLATYPAAPEISVRPTNSEPSGWRLSQDGTHSRLTRPEIGYAQSRSLCKPPLGPSSLFYTIFSQMPRTGEETAASCFPRKRLLKQWPVTGLPKCDPPWRGDLPSALGLRLHGRGAFQSAVNPCASERTGRFPGIDTDARYGAIQVPM